jgi:putative transposase
MGMPRTRRIVEPGHPYHVVFRGNNRRRLFSRSSDYLRFLALLASAVNENCDVHNVNLQSNHGHWLGIPHTPTALSELMKQVAQRYAQYRNRSRGGSGKLFEERFYAKRIESDEHYARSHAYIDDNGRRAGRATGPAEYRWSSYHLYASDGDPRWRHLTADFCTPSPWYLDLATDPRRRAERYTAFVTACAGDPSRHPAHVKDIVRLELASQPYTQRLLRPDGTSAR